MSFPEPCAKCASFGGSWMETETGLKRCDCPRGIALAAKTKEPEYHEPVITTEQAMIYAEMMASIPFFPTEAGARAVIANEIASMCESLDRAEWLAVRMIRLYRKWPGVIELRIVFCSKYQPLDALPEIGASEAYPDGVPSERPPEKAPALLRGREDVLISAAPSVEATVRDLAIKTDLKRYGAPAKVRDIPVRQLTEADRITPEMIRKAEEEFRASKARRERDEGLRALGLEVPLDEPGETPKEPENAEGSGSTEGV
jgi:hypothetical protein